MTAKDKPRDPIHERIVIGVRVSGIVAVDRARSTNTPLVIWRNNRVELVSPDEIHAPSPQANGKHH
jgi:hypothetical protein